MCPRLILFFDESNVSIDLAGGKGVNLAILKRNGFPVPNGFIITTQAYQAFIETNNLAEFIDKQMAGLTFDNYDSIDSASTLIRDRFTTGVMPSELVEQTYQAYEKLNNAPVAVRSSATMEDLPGFSFAGQHDTFLNVITKETLLEAVVKCFSSLWTARVIQYRHRNDVSHKDLSIAVVVQEMVASEASGVLFSANPLTGKRNEVVIEAILGLGEVLVSGQVEPDRYTVDIDGRILSKKLGSKSVVIHGSRSGGTLVRTEDARDHPALTDKQIQELAQLGYRVGKYYDSPQDIEWAFTGEKLYLLQARPITSLYPLPSKLSPDPFRILFSFNIIQGLLDPITPLGQDVIQSFLLGVGKIFGYHISFEAQTALWSAAERLWINITPLIRNRFLRQISQKALPVVEPETMHILNSLLDDPQLASNIGLPKLRTLKNFTRIYLVLLKQLLSNIKEPDARRQAVKKKANNILRAVKARSNEVKSTQERLKLYENIVDILPRLLILEIFPLVPAAYIPFLIINQLTSKFTTDASLILTLTRSLPYNVTNEMNIALWNTARTIKADPDSISCFKRKNVGDLVTDYLNNSLPMTTQAVIKNFLKIYGIRGIAEIDIGCPRWYEDPTPLFETLQIYSTITDPQQAPDAVFMKGVKTATEAYRQLFSIVRASRGGSLKIRGLNAGIRRIRALAGMREYPKFILIRLLGIARNLFLAIGQESVDNNILTQADDIFFLHYSELKRMISAEPYEWVSLVAERRKSYNQEQRRQQIPRLLLSDGRTFYKSAGMGIKGIDTLTGSPVSPGTVEGKVRVVLSPYGSQLEPGEILVCPATDPAWTPLFLAAGGLVMELGGMMTHGSVVAREYGIPAVVGVPQATRQLKTGQLVRLDGTTGQIFILK